MRWPGSLRQTATESGVVKALGSGRRQLELAIVRETFKGAQRFREFQGRLGVAKNILSVRLKSLIVQGILKIAPASDGRAHRKFILTRRGQALLPILLALGLWGRECMLVSNERRGSLIGETSKRWC
jgi:DNA-binding HxlR family transcriptional regulator